MLTAHDWLQIEQAAAGCVSGSSDEWPDLRKAIKKVTGNPTTFQFRKSAAWLQGFCEGVLARPTGKATIPTTETVTTKCGYTFNSEHQRWDTECDDVIALYGDESPFDYGFKFCPFCGNKVSKQLN